MTASSGQRQRYWQRQSENTGIHTKPGRTEIRRLLSIEPETDSSSFEADIDTFETMDVDAIQDKIRGECRHLIKELNLEHLTGDETGKVKR